MFTLTDDDMRALMKLLFKQDTFDAFDLRQLTIQSFARFDIEGGKREDPESGQAAQFGKWSVFRPYASWIIKTGGKPGFMKIVFSCSKEMMEEYPGSQALFINIIFDKDIVHVTTGQAARNFSQDKAEENRWDGYTQEFLRANNINIQIHEE